jgi:hypothetical protein
MSKSLERFIRDNREKFDADQPSPASWEKIEQSLNATKQRSAVYRLNGKKWWLIAAAVLAIVLTSSLYIFLHPGHEEMPVVQNTMPGNTSPENNTGDPVIEAIDPDYAARVAKFSVLIEKKQHELEAIRTDQPDLYKKFSRDIQRLDSTYHALKYELPVNPNKEELLQAMIYNLQLQIDLLNQQLNIIQKIKQAKSASL